MNALETEVETAPPRLHDVEVELPGGTVRFNCKADGSPTTIEFALTAKIIVD